MLQLFSFYQNGHLPQSGGISEQPYKIMRALQIIGERKALNAERRTRGKKAPR